MWGAALDFLGHEFAGTTIYGIGKKNHGIHCCVTGQHSTKSRLTRAGASIKNINGGWLIILTVTMGTCHKCVILQWNASSENSRHPYKNYMISRALLSNG